MSCSKIVKLAMNNLSSVKLAMNKFVIYCAICSDIFCKFSFVHSFWVA